ncbi:NAD(P)-binding protein [Setomelanomma holmii]|uniref:NAD(P)-binding protein n=1 Tax=Setomelanomma holmii TaxID=210430 RepID=A0A9P4LK65_9PLEO|nr:NAD(P)-binding protein [Setomelanomma holmii]
MQIVVFGASGVQGRHQVHHLARCGHNVVAISRHPAKLPSDVDADKVESVAADFADTKAFHNAVRGADRVFVNLPSTSFNKSGPIIIAAKTIGEAARNAGVPLILFNTNDRREMRRLLRESGVPVISIEPVVYLDNLLEGWALTPIKERETIVYCHKPDLRVSWICHHDVAQIMCAAMLRPGFAGRDIPVGGPETVRLEELTKKLSHAWGREFSHENQTVADFCDKISKTMQGRGLETDKIVSQMFKAYTYYNEAEDEPFNVDMRSIMEDLGVRLTPVEEWAKRRSRWDDKGYC